MEKYHLREKVKLFAGGRKLDRKKCCLYRMADMNESMSLSPNVMRDPTSQRACSGFLPSTSVQTMVQMTFYGILILASLIGNAFVIVVFYRRKRLRTTVHYFIVNIAISDLAIPVIILPSEMSSVFKVWLVDGALGSILCKLVWYAWGVSATVSIFSMVVIAIDRFHAVLFATKPAFFSRRTCHRLIVVMWVSALVLWAHYFYGYGLVYRNTRLACVFSWGSMMDTKKVLMITWMAFLSLSFLSAIALTVLYSSFVIFLCRTKNNFHLAPQIVQNRAKKNRRIACMLAIITVAFFALCTPFNIWVIMRSLEPNIRSPCLFIWFASYVLPVLYPVLNPVVYYIFNDEYRKGFKELLCCPWSCTKCKTCFQTSVSSQVVNNNTNARDVTNVENIEFQAQ